MINLKKTLATCTTAALMIGCMSAAPVLAGEIGDDGTYTGNDTTISIDKDLVIYNDGFTKSYSPSITYRFQIEAAYISNGTTVTDNIGRSIAVKSGLISAFAETISEVTFASQEVTEATADQNFLAEALRGNIEFTVDPSQFTDPGIYRYVITDITSDSALINAGIIRPEGYEDSKQLDVYIVRSSTPGELEVASYVLTDSNTVTSITPATAKDSGFRTSITTPSEIPVPGTPAQPGSDDSEYGNSGIDGDNDFDYYVTYNIDIDKVIAGNMADLTYQFPFEAVINNGLDGNNLTVSDYVYFGEDESQLTADNNGTATAGLANGERLYVYGINPFATVTVTEANDSGSTYNLTTSDGANDKVAIASGEEGYATPIVVSNISRTAVNHSISSTANDVTFTNDLQAGPPTGLKLAIGAFAAVAALVAGLFCFNKVKVDKKNTASEENK